MDGRLGTLLLKGSAQRLAVDGNHLRRYAGQRGHPRHEAALKLLAIQRGKNIAEMIMSGSSMLKRTEAAQKIELFLAKPGDIDDGLGSRQYRQQTQQQNLLERVHHLAALPRVGQILE